jgi:glycosyltransferase involved in cell wall biosynthesis
VTPTPAIAVVLPAWNAEATLGAALASLQAQTEPDFELLVVDDGSTDGTAALVAAAGSQDPRVRLLQRPHGGIVAALNAGLAATRAPLIARMDADDVAHPRRLAVQRAMLEADAGLGLVSCLVAHAGDAGDTRGYAVHVDWLNGLLTPEAIALARFVEAPLAHPSVMFRRELLDRHGGYIDGEFPEDYELWLRWLDAGVRMAKAPEVLLTWRDGPNRLSRTHPRYDVAAFYRLKAAWLARWLVRHGHTRVVVWGSGKTSRQRSAFLTAHGIVIAAYVDIDPRRAGGHSRGTPILAPEDLGAPGGAFVVSYVGKRGAGAYIQGWLTARGWCEGRDFLLAA